MTREYQSNFTGLYPHSGQTESRKRKAETILRVLEAHFGESRKLASMKLLDVGASTGVIDATLAEHVGSVLGVDIDKAAITRAQGQYQRSNLIFKVGDGMALETKDNEYDIVICAHVYEHVPSAERLMQEIRRVLKPGGVCYFSAGNRFQIMEPHYRLPLLSVLPKFLAHIYLRLVGRGTHYYETHCSYWGLKKLVRGFKVHDYTYTLIAKPEQFGLSYLLPPQSWKQRFAILVSRIAYGLVPTYIWLLEK